MKDALGIPNWLFEYDAIDPYAFNVLLYLAFFKEAPSCSIAIISKKLGMKVNKVTQSLDTLKRLGFFDEDSDMYIEKIFIRY